MGLHGAITFTLTVRLLSVTATPTKRKSLSIFSNSAKFLALCFTFSTIYGAVITIINIKQRGAECHLDATSQQQLISNETLDLRAPPPCNTRATSIMLINSCMVLKCLNLTDTAWLICAVRNGIDYASADAAKLPHFHMQILLPGFVDCRPTAQ
jgi:hypothetical protein